MGTHIWICEECHKESGCPVTTHSALLGGDTGRHRCWVCGGYCGVLLYCDWHIPEEGRDDG